MTHGLTSRMIVETRLAEIERLAKVLAKEAPDAVPVQQTARALAKEMFSLEAIHHARLELFKPKYTGPSIDYVEELLRLLDDIETYSKTELLVLNEELREDFESVSYQQRLLYETWKRNRHKMRILDEYERKVTSRYLKLVNRLDYLTIETKRSR